MTNDRESKNEMVGHEEKEHLVPLLPVFGYTSSYPKPASTDCPIQIQELTKEHLRMVTNFRVLFLAQVLNVSSVRIINFLNGQFRKLVQERTLKELLNCLILSFLSVG